MFLQILNGLKPCKLQCQQTWYHVHKITNSSVLFRETATHNIAHRMSGRREYSLTKINTGGPRKKLFNDILLKYLPKDCQVKMLDAKHVSNTTYHVTAESSVPNASRTNGILITNSNSTCQSLPNSSYAGLLVTINLQPNVSNNISRQISLATPNVTNTVRSFSTTSQFNDAESTNEEVPKSRRAKKVQTKRQVSKERGKEVVMPVENADVINIMYSAAQKDHLKTFPAPKNIINNIFNLIASELNDKKYNLTPSYKASKRIANTSLWTCTYHLNWPQELNFTSCNTSKGTASTEAALAALIWLKANNKINDKHQPLLYDSNDVVTIKKEEKSLVLHIDPYIQTKFEKIYEVYNDTFKPYFENNPIDDYIANDKLNKGIGNPDDWPTVANPKRQQRFRGTNFYATQELIVLPISQFKNDIINLVNKHRIVIVRGQPGCGKSTRVPQYIMEGWANKGGESGEPCQIVVTQPRRIAAISLAERVAHERCEQVGDTIAFSVRMNTNYNPRNTRIHYLTTGILLRRLQSDPTLRQLTHVILDEAHERDVNTDLLLNLLRQALRDNPDLKVLVMSATIDTGTFQQYFEKDDGVKPGDVGVIEVPGFTYPVKDCYLDQLKIDLSKTWKMVEGEEPRVVPEDVAKIINQIHRTKPEGAILCFLPGWEDMRKIRLLLEGNRSLFVLCLHSRLQDAEQRKIFSKAPSGLRKVILATNIAETSVTINDVVYVVDTGIHKDRTMDVDKGILCLDNHWISHASLEQRRGRAGRCQPGQSYHLYPKAHAEKMIPYTVPEILRTSLTKIVLDSKVYSKNMLAVEFLAKLPSPPDTGAIEKAVEELKELQLLDENEFLTPLGRTLSEFQLEPKLAKSLVHAVIFKCVTPVVDIITLFSAETEIFASAMANKDAIAQRKREFCSESDHLALMRIFEKWLDFADNEDYERASRFCYTNSLLDYKLETLKKLREIHFGYLTKGLNPVLQLADDCSDNDELVKGVLLSCIGTVLQHRNWNIVKGRMKKTHVLLTRHNHHATISSESVNHKRTSFPSDYLLYMNETRSVIKRSTVIRETSFLSPLTVLLFNNKDITLEDITTPNFSKEITSNDQVLVQLKDSKIKFLCDRKQAVALQNCKKVLNACLKYYTYQLTSGNPADTNLNAQWNYILNDINDILQKCY